jgi:adenine/guanine phosphoribosyltransferase-like PRPP-binding protein
MIGAPTQYIGRSVHSSLERQFIVDDLAENGYTLKEMQTLPDKLAKKLMAGACLYASLRLAEIESCSQFIRKIHYEG